MTKITTIENYPIENKGYSQPSLDEIDLLDIVQLIWRKKLFIGVVTACCAAISFLYVLFAPQKWSSQAWLLAPHLEQIQQYVTERQAYARIMQEKEDLPQLQANLFSAMVDLVNSPDWQMTFLRSTDYFAQQTQDFSPSQQQRWLAINTPKIIRVIAPDATKKTDYYQITVQANQAAEAQKLLQDFILQSSQKSLTVNHQKFIEQLKSLTLDLLHEKQNIDQQLIIERSNTIKELNEYYLTAQKSGIISHYVNESTIQIINNRYPFLLGSKVLAAEKETLEKSPIIYPYRYHQIIDQLAELNKLSWSLEDSQSYSYMMHPTFPFEQDQPKSGLLMVLSVMLGVLLSTLIVLFQYVYLNKKAQ